MAGFSFQAIRATPPRDTYVLTFLMLGVLVISAFTFLHYSLRLDEAQSLWQASRSPQAILSIVARDVHVPLYHLMLNVWRTLFGESVEIARMLSLLFYVLTIPVVYALGTISYTRSIGLFAAVLFSVSPFMNWYGNEIRMYTLFVFLAALNQYFFVRLFTLKDTASWPGYAVTAVAGVFAHYFFILNLGVQALFYVFSRMRFSQGSLLRFGAIAASITVLFIPWVLAILVSGDVEFQQPVLPPPTTVNLFNVFSEFIFGFQPDRLNTAIVSLWPVTLLIIGFFALRKKSWLTPEGIYLLMTLFVSIAAAFTISIAIRPLFVSRYLIFVLPAFYILITAILSVYPPRIERAARTILVTFMLLALALTIFGRVNPIAEDYRSATDFLTNNADAHDIVLISAPFTIYPIEYYYRGAAPIATLPPWDRYSQGAIPPFDAEALPQEVSRLTDRYERVWVVLSVDQGYEEDIRQYFEQNYLRIERHEFDEDIEVSLYRLRYDTPGDPQ